ncbi:MAG: glycosyltransferase family 2 protein [Gemmatimonadaceae bacterium]|nr:glycosyltransferase family 2 protein [Gemmatimonadaceae bacterium]
MTVYNAEKFLNEAIRSLVDQTFQEWELVVIDNGSRDESPAILSGYADTRIRMELLGENIGRTPALRRAFNLARGEYIAVLDADDVSHPERLVRQIAYLDAHPGVVVVGTWAKRIDVDSVVTGDYSPPTDAAAIRDSFGWTNPIIHSSAMYRRANAAAVGGYPADLPYSADCGLWLRLGEVGELAIIDEQLCSYRVVPQSVTRSTKLQGDVASDIHHMYSEARRRLQLSPESLRKNREELTIARCRYGLALAQSGRSFEAARVLGAELLSNPRGMIWNRVVRAWLGR